MSLLSPGRREKEIRLGQDGLPKTLFVSMQDKFILKPEAERTTTHVGVRGLAGVGWLLCRWLPGGASLHPVFVPCGRVSVVDDERKKNLSQQVFLEL